MQKESSTMERNIVKNLHPEISEVLLANDSVNDELIPFEMFDESSQTNSNVCWSKTNELKYTDEAIVKRVYAMARDVDKILRENHITYWTSSGTTLGCLRHRGLIPWDDDLDICVYQEDENKLLSIKTILLSKGYKICEAELFGYRIFHESNSDPMQNEMLNYRYPFCDVYVMAKNKNKTKCFISAAAGRVLWPEEYYYVKDIEKLERRLFGDVFLNCAANAENYLSRYYGDDWNKIGATHNYDHIAREYVNPVRFELLNHHFQPAKPFH